MNSTDIEKAATNKIEELVLKNSEFLSPYINSKQIKHRKKNLSFNDKKLLNDISEKEEHMNNYPILCCIDILLNNNFEFDIHYKNMKKKDKEIFNTWPIYNLLKK